MYPQSMFWNKNKKNRYTPAYASFFYIKVGFKGVNIAQACFLMPAEKRLSVNVVMETCTIYC